MSKPVDVVAVRRKRRRFVDAPQDERCAATISLRDGSLAQCGRRKKVGGLCRQHATLVACKPTGAEK